MYPMTEREKDVFALAKKSLGEKIIWNESYTVSSAIGTSISIDAVGKDPQGRTVIVEVKTKSRAKNPNDRQIANRDAEHKAVGQILDYATAYMEQHGISPKDLRLIIVADYRLETVDKICLFLCEQGIHIEQISV